jgi:hypothetical protein
MRLENIKADKGTCYFVQSFCPLTNSGSPRPFGGRMPGCIMTSTHVRAQCLYILRDLQFQFFLPKELITEIGALYSIQYASG